MTTFSPHLIKKILRENEMMGTGGRSKAHSKPVVQIDCFAVESGYPALNALKYGQTHHAER